MEVSTMNVNQASVYFLDDESQVLGALRRALRLRLKGWTMVFESSPSRTLDLMSHSTPWVVVVDKKMPEIDGAEFLNEIKALYPDAVRVILSGDISHETVVESAGIAHLLLSKPFELDEIVAVIERAVCLRTFQLDDELRAGIGNIDNLPILPANYDALVTYLNSVDEPDYVCVAELISHDIAVLSKILQLANSAFFGAAVPAYSAHDAVVRLGHDLVRKLVLCFELYTAKGDLDLHNQLLKSSERIAEGCVKLATASQLSREDTERAYFTGLLHNIGELVLAGQNSNISSDLAGSFLLKLWGFDQRIVDAVRHQSSPGKNQETDPVIYQLNVVKTLVNGDSSLMDMDVFLESLDPNLLKNAQLSDYVGSFS